MDDESREQFTIARSEDLTYTSMPGGSYAGADLIMFDLKKTRVLEIRRNGEYSLVVKMVSEDGNQHSGYIRACDGSDTGKRKLENIEAVADSLVGISYDELVNRTFAISPKAYSAVFSETMKVREMLKGQVREGEPGKVAPHYEFVEKDVASGDPRLSDGVHVSMVIDRRGDVYKQMVKDARTGEVIHEEHEPLSQHRSKSDRKTDGNDD